MANIAYGYWWDPTTPDDKLSGQLTWEPLKSPKVSLMDPPPMLWWGSPHPSGTALPMLHGRLATKGAVTLLDSVWYGIAIGAGTAETLLVDTVLSGVWLETADEAFIRRVEITWPALRGLLGDYAVKPHRLPSGRSRQVRFNLDRKRLEWTDKDVTVTFQYEFPLSMSPIESSIRAKPIVVLTSGKPRSYRWWRKEWLVPLNDFMTVVTGAKSNPQSVRVWQTKNLNKRSRHSTAIEVIGRGIGDHEYELDKVEVLVTAEDLGRNPDGIHDILGRLHTLSKRYPVFLELLIDVANSPDRPFEIATWMW